MNYLFFGTSDFAQVVLRGLIQANFSPTLIVTTPPKPVGRKQILTPSLVNQVAQEFHLPVLTPVKLTDPDFIEILQNTQPEFALLTAYGKIIPPLLLTLPQRGFVNLHPSLLPRWRGATPIQATLLAGDQETGATLFQMDELIDHGPILNQSVYQITNPRLTFLELSKILAQLGIDLILKTIPLWLENKITPRPQEESLATFCHKITPQDEHLDWHTSAFLIDRKVRALNPQPGVYTLIQNKILKILKGFPLASSNFSQKGEIGQTFEYLSQGKKLIAVQCQTDFYVIEELQLAGKKSLSSDQFLLGNHWFLGQILS